MDPTYLNCVNEGASKLREKARILIYNAPGYFLKITILIFLSFEGIALP